MQPHRARERHLQVPPSSCPAGPPQLGPRHRVAAPKPLQKAVRFRAASHHQGLLLQEAPTRRYEPGWCRVQARRWPASRGRSPLGAGTCSAVWRCAGGVGGEEAGRRTGAVEEVAGKQSLELPRRAATPLSPSRGGGTSRTSAPSRAGGGEKLDPPWAVGDGEDVEAEQGGCGGDDGI